MRTHKQVFLTLGIYLLYGREGTGNVVRSVIGVTPSWDLQAESPYLFLVPRICVLPYNRVRNFSMTTESINGDR